MSQPTPSPRTRYEQTAARLAQLPVPDADARAVSEALVARLRNEIDAAGGGITFARYMELALYAPGLGYYAAGSHKLGAAGDFVTAPELSPLFARCVAQQVREVCGLVTDAAVLEVGAGSGALCADLLLELARLDALPAHYYILEVSADLRERQHHTLATRAPHLAGRVSWLAQLPEPGFRGVVLANELLDAMPVHRVGLDAQGIFEHYVTWHQGAFAWLRGDPSDVHLVQRMQSVAPGLLPPYVSEINLAAEAWIASVAGVLGQGVLLLIDYGFPRHEFYHPQRGSGTLMCHYRHRAHDDPFCLPGLQDITAHVDFTALAEAAHAAGLDVAGFTNQAQFLLACGLGEIVAQLADGNGVLTPQVTQQIKLLTLPSEMGELFKVLALTRGVGEPLLGFGMQDQRERL